MVYKNPKILISANKGLVRPNPRIITICRVLNSEYTSPTSMNKRGEDMPWKIMIKIIGVLPSPEMNNKGIAIIWLTDE